ncbi:hypothetical protein D3C87_921490 [compost metagenome]
MAVVLAHGGRCLFALDRLAVEGFVDGCAERVPQLLFVAAVERHALRLVLPALLQRLHGVDAQHRLGAQLCGLGDHGLAAFDAGLLRGFERGTGSTEGFVPQRLQLGKHLLAHVAGIAPAVGELVQRAVVRLQVGGAGMGGGPGLDLFDQRDAQGAVFGGIGTHLLEPGLDDLVGFVAGFVETLPQRVVRHAALVGLLPLVAQGAQGFLHLAATEGLAFGALEQAFGLGDEVFAHLVGAPALPAFEFAGGDQCGMHAGFERRVDQLAVFLEHGAQRSGGAGAGLAVAFGGFLFELGEGGLHGVLRRGAHGRVDLGCGGTGGRGGLGRHHFAARGAQFVGPDGHRRQRRGGIGRGGNGLRQRAVERIGHHEQLRLGGFELGGELGVEAVPVGVGHDVGGLLLPVGHVGAQRFLGGLGVLPALGGQHFEALRQQDGGFAVDLRAVLQVFDALDALGQLGLQPGQRFARQRRAGLGGVTLPGQCVGDVELGLRQQRFGLLRPFGGDGFLALGAFDFVELFAQQARGALVAAAQLLEDLLHLLGRRVAREPVADARGALARGRRGEGAAGERVEGLEVVWLGRSRGHCAKSLSW